MFSIAFVVQQCIYLLPIPSLANPAFAVTTTQLRHVVSVLLNADFFSAARIYSCGKADQISFDLMRQGYQQNHAELIDERRIEFFPLSLRETLRIEVRWFFFHIPCSVFNSLPSSLLLVPNNVNHVVENTGPHG